MKTRTGRNIGAPSQNVRRTAKSRVGVNSSQLKKSGRNSARLQKASTKQGNVRGIVAGTLGEKTSRKVIRSYKELHPVGKRRSSQFVTYSQDGRLFYDLYARSSPYSSVAKAVSTTHKSSPDSATPNNPDFVSETSRGSMKKKEKQSANKPVPIVIRSVRQSRAADRNFVSASSATARVSHITRRKASKLQVDPVRKASTRESTNPHGQISKIRASTLKMKPRNSDSPSQRHVRPHKRARRESVPSVERKLRRELGTSTSIVAVGKRMASLNATALITAVTRSPYDRTAVANPCDDRRVSSETIPCLDEYPGDVLDLAADKSDDSKTESMRGTPEHAAGADELDVPSVEKPAKVRPTKRIRRNRSVSQKSNSLQVTPAIVNPTGPALESYHSQHFIPFGDSRFGFQQITHQVVRMGTPDKISGSTTKTLSYSETQLHPLSHSLHQGTVPDVSSIVRPQSTDPNLCHPMIPVVNTGPLTCGSLCFPILTPLSSLGNWPYPQLAVQNFGFNGVPFQSPGFFIPSVAAYSPQLQITTQCPILSPISQQMAYPNNFIRPPVAGANVGTPGAPTFTCIQPHQLGSTCTPFSPLCYPAVSACEMHPSLGQLHPSPMPPRGFLGVSSSGQVSIQYPPTAEPFASQPIQLMAVPNASIPHPQVVPTIPPSPPSLQPPQNQSRTPFSVLSVLPSEHLLTVRNVCDPSALCSKPAASIAVAECTAPVHSEVMPTGITTIPAPDFATESTVQNPCPDSNVPEFGQNTVEGKDFESASNTEDPGAISDDSEGAWEWEGKPYEKLVFVQVVQALNDMLARLTGATGEVVGLSYT
ncbi:unnamed protein product [Calicophoron daubneyi]|uniref:Uncharacterized protein n=1 Tax=Calicophoron daubneyi TaxID=300641 RepID=A0AAV2TSB4_CALDB